MTRREREQRELEVFELRARRFSWAEIEQRTGVRERTGRRMVARQFERLRADRLDDPHGVVDELVVFLERQMSDLSALARDTRHDHVRLGAIKALIDAGFSYADLLRAAGRLPRQLSALPVEREMQRMFREFAEILDRHGVADDALADVLALSERNLTGMPVAVGAAA